MIFFPSGFPLSRPKPKESAQRDVVGSCKIIVGDIETRDTKGEGSRRLWRLLSTRAEGGCSRQRRRRAGVEKRRKNRPAWQSRHHPHNFFLAFSSKQQVRCSPLLPRLHSLSSPIESRDDALRAGINGGLEGPRNREAPNRGADFSMPELAADNSDGKWNALLAFPFPPSAPSRSRLAFQSASAATSVLL